MFSDLLKVLEILINAVKGVTSPDHKRQALAKQLSRLHREIEAVVDRGRIILGMEPAHQMSKYNPAVSLLSEQVTAIREIDKTLTSGVIDEVLQIHLPGIRKGLAAHLDSKSNRVWIRLTGLISYDDIFPPNSVGTKEALLAAKEQHDIGSTAWRPSLKMYDRLIDEDGPLSSDLTQRLMDQAKIGINASNEELQKGYQLLDQISAANSELRKFLIERFKFEDIL
jgi:hypothetical protein